MKEKFSKIEKVLLVVLGTLFGFTSLSDPDFGWHFKYGEYFIKNGHLLRDNIFSYTMPDYKWANSYWISEIFLYLAVSFLGTLLLNLILGALISWLEIFLIEKTNAGKTAKFFSLIILWTTLGGYFINIRPLYFSTLFFILITYALLFKPKLVYFSPLLFLLWVNMHADFILGLAVIGIYLFFDSLAIYFGKSSKYFLKIVTNAGTFISCAAATLINPYGVNLWKTIFNDISNQTQASTISEWMGILHIEKLHILLILNVVPGLILMIYLSAPIFKLAIDALNKKFSEDKNLWWLASVNILFLALSFRSVYFLRILFILSLTQTAVFWDEIQKKVLGFLTNIKPVHISLVKKLTIFITVVSAIANVFMELPSAVNMDKLGDKYFCGKGTINFIKDSNLQGNMFNSFDLGGFLISNLPQKKVFIDGRMNSWKDSSGRIFDGYIKIYKHPKDNYPLFLTYVEKYDIEWLIFHKNSDIAKFFKEKTQEWKLSYSDKGCVIFEKI